MVFAHPQVSRMRQPWQNTLTVIGLLCFLLAACGGPTGYTKANPDYGLKYGYKDKFIGQDEYSVVATGNEETSNARVVDIALLRAAHLTKENNRTHFILLKKMIEEVTAYESVSAPLGGALVWVTVGEQEIKEPHAVLIIKLLPNDATLPDDALSAAAIIKEVGARLEKPNGN